jgi:hypothetical protein
MSVYKKLQAARLELSQATFKKSGFNSFADFNYFELGDFLPTTHFVFNTIGICGVFSFDVDDTGKEWCRLRVVDVDNSNDFVDFTSPVVYAQMTKSNPIQVLGSTHTYMRRYMWLLALELTERDQVDAMDQSKLAPPKQAPSVKVEKVNEAVTVVTVDNMPKGLTEEQKLLIEGLLKFGECCTTKDDLIALWKKNQTEIDKLKVASPEEYQVLLDGYSVFKAKFE